MKQIRVSKKEGEPEIGKKLKKILAALKEKGNWGFLELFFYFFRRFLFYFSSVLFGDIFADIFDLSFSNLYMHVFKY